MARDRVRTQGRRMEPSAQAVLAVAGVSLIVILGALLAIARRDRRLADGRTSAARVIPDDHARKVTGTARAPIETSAEPPAPAPTPRPPVTAAPAITGPAGPAGHPRLSR